MYRIKNKKSHDHGENHQGVDRQENQCYRLYYRTLLFYQSSQTILYSQSKSKMVWDRYRS